MLAGWDSPQLPDDGDWPDGTGSAVSDVHVLAARLEIYATTPVLGAH